MRHFKIAVLCLFALFLAVAFTVPREMVEGAEASSAGPPPGFSGAPDENNCTACHVGPSNNGQFAILDAPVTYKPGQIYQLRVRHVNADTTRKRWGFQMTALAGPLGAGDFINITTNTQVVLDNGRQYVQHTSAGTFAGQTGGAEWPINWTAPPTSVGPVSMYAAGNQANQGTGPDGDQIYTASVTMLAPRPNLFDFDGDAKTDIGIYRPNGANGAEWWYLKSSNGGSFATQFGTAADKIVAADYTGDGRGDIAFWRPSTGFWYVLRSEDLTYFAVPFGTTGDVPVPSDFDADGKADVAVFRPSTATWFIANSTGNTTIRQFGQAGDLPIPADYDGDGRSDIAIYRPSLGQWWLLRSTAGTVAYQFGTTSDKTVAGDYTGDGKTDVAFWRPATGEWYVLRSEDLSFYAFPFGTSTDTPVPGDYDGDGKYDAGVFRPSNTTWYVNRSTAGVLIQQFGSAGDVPVPSAYVR
ncbi:MAG: FG-GAP-like repeat-containing protein [Pyrinomonadaceae bacterium]|nr:FG-GAP-like repeat-containing protein [Pyrinomonadaceae bacterium]